MNDKELSSRLWSIECKLEAMDLNTIHGMELTSGGIWIHRDAHIQCSFGGYLERVRLPDYLTAEERIRRSDKHKKQMAKIAKLTTA
jgi:hypothetical protein